MPAGEDTATGPRWARPGTRPALGCVRVGWGEGILRLNCLWPLSEDTATYLREKKPKKAVLFFEVEILDAKTREKLCFLDKVGPAVVPASWARGCWAWDPSFPELLAPGEMDMPLHLCPDTHPLPFRVGSLYFLH